MDKENCRECKAGLYQAMTTGYSIAWRCMEHGEQSIELTALITSSMQAKVQRERAERAEARVSELEVIAAYANAAYWSWKYATSIPSLDATMADLGELLEQARALLPAAPLSTPE